MEANAAQQAQIKVQVGRRYCRMKSNNCGTAAGVHSGLRQNDAPQSFGIGFFYEEKYLKPSLRRPLKRPVSRPCGPCRQTTTFNLCPWPTPPQRRKYTTGTQYGRYLAKSSFSGYFKGIFFIHHNSRGVAAEGGGFPIHFYAVVGADRMHFYSIAPSLPGNWGRCGTIHQPTRLNHLF